MINLEEPEKNAAYFQLGKTSLSLLIQSFVSTNFPAAIGNFISVDSLVVNWNPFQTVVGAKTLPATSAQNSVVAKSSADCQNTLQLLSFTPPFPGVSLLMICFSLLLLIHFPFILKDINQCHQPQCCKWPHSS